MPKTLLFCGSPDFACPSLNHLITNKHWQIHVITQPDKVRSRGKKTSPTPVKTLAQTHKLPVHTPPSKETFSTIVNKLNPDLIIVIAYGMIIPESITSNYYCINAHASILPQYRGASPIQTSLLNQDSKTGVTLIHMNENLDEGPILDIQSIPINPSDNFQSLHDSLATLSATAITKISQDFLENNLPKETPQDHKNATYCKKIQKKDLELNPKNPIEKTLAKIKAFSPIPGAYIQINNKRIKILDAEIKSDTLIPKQVKPEGKPVMSYHDYCQGQRPPIQLC